MALRHKIMLAFFVFLFTSLVFTGIVYHRHVIIQEKLKFIERADDLYNNVLEARRYEKNLILYGGRENLEELLGYLDLAENQLKEFQTEGTTKATSTELNRIRDVFKNYREAVKQQEPEKKSASNDSLLEAPSLRDYGRTLTEIIEAMVGTERKLVDELVDNQKRSLFYSLSLFVLLTVGLFYYFYFLIFEPLSAIQSATAEITKGNVRKIPPVTGSPEIQSLISALNQMIQELDKKSEQLIQQEKMVALGTLTSGVAHELNNPLSNISSTTQILLEELEENNLEFQREMLQGVEQQIEKARDIVRSLLEFAREKEFEPVLTDVESLIQNTVKLVRGEVPANVDIHIEVPKSLEVEVDRRRITQALMNLVINGLQAMEETGGVLKVRAFLRILDQKLIMEVSDQGVGIPSENIPKIFDPFFSTKDVGNGTGLGLYVTYGIVQKHHGEIFVESRTGQGARFTLVLPQKQPEEECV